MENGITDEYDEIEKFIPAQVKEIRSTLARRFVQECARIVYDKAKHVHSISFIYLIEQHNLEIPEYCDQFIARCLRLKDGNLENVIKIMLTFRVAIQNMKTWNTPLQPSKGLVIYEMGLAVPLIKKNSSTHRTLVLRTGPWDQNQISSKEILEFFWMIMQYAQSELLDVQINGMTMIWDFAYITLQQAMAVHQLKLVQLVKWMQNGVLGRVSSVHLIHHPRPVGLIYKAIKPFLKEKMKRRIFFHDNLDSLLKFFGAENLPTFVGGSLETEDCIDKNLIQGFFGSDRYFQDMFETGFPSK